MTGHAVPKAIGSATDGLSRRRAVGVGEGAARTDGASGVRSRLIHPHASHFSSNVSISVQAISFAVTPVSSAMIHPVHAQGAFRIDERFNERMDPDFGAQCAEAAARLGVVMAVTSQRGFEIFTVHGGGPPGNPYRPDDIRAEVLARLCLVADEERSSFFRRVGEPCWMGRIDGGLGGAWRVNGCVGEG